eukprot:CAMPEP_0184495142 /NCGR_PEP_ID=MMETSP0113_2-20130426/30489_1 /TAXON_ID=91329 /ORGANISM="Norrisiella sphaerica, Strain BC52" /LENGTH=283 /DNA_ID=CAMNT_0026881201 /DNA_START=120 /DNA_END=967 /DNA_ORIENTATION=+
MSSRGLTRYWRPPRGAQLQSQDSNSSNADSNTTRVILGGSGRCTRQFEQLNHLFKHKNNESWVAYIPTAYMYLNHDSASKRTPAERRRRQWYEARKKGKLLAEKLNMRVETIDIAMEAWRNEDAATAPDIEGSSATTITAKNHAGDESKRNSELREKLKGASVIYVDGGNTFWLMHHIRQSGFLDICRKMVCEESCVYVGLSAGAIVACEHIGTAFWKGWDDPAIVEGVDWTLPSSLQAMKLIPNHVVFPHYSEKEHENLIESRSGELGPEQKLLMLRDDETL